MFETLLVLLCFTLIHLYANKANVLGWVWHERFLSFAGGVSFAYVFIDLLPKLEKSQPVIKNTLDPFLPYLDHHAYVIALLGLLFYYGLQGISQSELQSYRMSMGGYCLFNFIVGTSLSDPSNPEIQPLLLFMVAIGLHYFIHDHDLRKNHRDLYDRYGRWILVLMLLLGWIVGYFVRVPDAAIDVAIAFLSGSVMLNVMRHELPKREKGTYSYFLIGSLSYTTILLILNPIPVPLPGFTKYS